MGLADGRRCDGEGDGEGRSGQGETMEQRQWEYGYVEGSPEQHGREKEAKGMTMFNKKGDQPPG